ncbi:hypothetical protein AVEN_251505-1 [Araneus ventricosus]|uniref:Uncharacterized protein n=1 Tax=Araneus ventricosus TaxID=182803 RepID=A0A4Y2KC61_ARAVE|nr:hypothetical protein AVEN_251505-1 [Araneus ventricosus]
MNVVHPPLIEPHKIIIPPLNIKFGLAKNLVKAIDKNGPAFKRTVGVILLNKTFLIFFLSPGRNFPSRPNAAENLRNVNLRSSFRFSVFANCYFPRPRIFNCCPISALSPVRRFYPTPSTAENLTIWHMRLRTPSLFSVLLKYVSVYTSL